VWSERAHIIAKAIGGPVRINVLFDALASVHGWRRAVSTSALASAEALGFVLFEGGMWRRSHWYKPEVHGE
jgi:hypothetical protein